MSSRPSPRVAVFAGPNGAGKTTHAEAILDALGIGTFVNADYIARGLSGPRAATVAIEAGRIMLKRLRQLSASAEDFAFESTLSSRSFAPFLRGLKAQGYRVRQLEARTGAPRGMPCCRQHGPEGSASMAKTSAAHALTPPATALRRALAKSADRAQRLADAFQVSVPVESDPVKRAKPNASGPKRRT